MMRGRCPGERCVLAHQGWEGENRDFSNILLIQLDRALPGVYHTDVVY
jgi:hypothetical protein